MAMHGDYGYMEENRLGKPYDVKLLRRLARYAFPYKGVMALALLMAILLTLLDLAIPYLSKIAIDHYILAAYYRVETGKLKGEKPLRDFFTRHDRMITKSPDGTWGLVPQTDLKKMDPALLQRYRSMGLISQRPYYKIPAESFGEISSAKIRLAARALEDGSFAVPRDMLKELLPAERMKVRKEDLRGVLQVSLILIVFLALSFGLGYGEYYLLERTVQRIMQDIRIELFDRIQSQALTFFDRHPVGRLVTRVTNDIENLNEMFKSVAITVFKDILILTGILAVLLYLNWRLALLCFLLIPFLFGITLLFSSLAREAFRELRGGPPWQRSTPFCKRGSPGCGSSSSSPGRRTRWRPSPALTTKTFWQA
ncbi:MAG: ABC transporter ATP-binding protein [Deltaproteobacteria bacterium]|nr:ABC transporter ATP-binding protein [Deltaproteobacteria bacterium]